MCTAATYKTRDCYFGRTLDYEFSYGDEVTVTPRNYPLSFRGMGVMKRHYAMIGMAHMAEDYPLYYDAVNEKGLGMAGLNFVGNVEPRDIPFHKADVLVCDGFAGNTVLKFAEGLSMALLGIIKEEITTGLYKIPAAMLLKPFKNIKKKFDSEEVGGAPFLGLKSLVVKAHGSSKAKGIKNAIKQCEIFVENDIVLKIEEKL